MNNINNTAANAVGSSGGSGGIMPKLKAVPANQNKKKDGIIKGVFEISSREDQYAKVGMAHKKGHAPDGGVMVMGSGAAASSTLVVDESP